MQTVFEPAGLSCPVHTIWNDDIERLVFLGILHRDTVHQQPPLSTYNNYTGLPTTLICSLGPGPRFVLHLKLCAKGTPGRKKVMLVSITSASVKDSKATTIAGEIADDHMAFPESEFRQAETASDTLSFHTHFSWFGNSTQYIRHGRGFLWYGTSLLLLGSHSIFA